VEAEDDQHAPFRRAVHEPVQDLALQAHDTSSGSQGNDCQGSVAPALTRVRPARLGSPMSLPSGGPSSMLEAKESEKGMRMRLKPFCAKKSRSRSSVLSLALSPKGHLHIAATGALDL
jgi:hypothetical protein